MTDLAPTADATRSCPRCGEQNSLDALPQGREAERGDLEVLEVQRAASVAGYDTEFAVDGETLTCPVCHAAFALADVEVQSAERAQDTASGGQDMDVVTCTCPTCGASGHAVAGAGSSTSREQP